MELSLEKWVGLPEAERKAARPREDCSKGRNGEEAFEKSEKLPGWAIRERCAGKMRQMGGLPCCTISEN